MSERMTDSRFAELDAPSRLPGIGPLYNEMRAEARRARASEAEWAQRQVTVEACALESLGAPLGVDLVDAMRAAGSRASELAAENATLRALLVRCAADVGNMLLLLEGHHRPQRWSEEVQLLQELVADLRAAGVEPTP